MTHNLASTSLLTVACTCDRLGMDAVKVAVVHYAGGESCIKVWRFFTDQLNEYTVATVSKYLMAYFPDIAKRRVGARLSYLDSMTGRIAIETDSDLQAGWHELPYWG